MISRYLVIVLAFVASGFRIVQGAWVEAIGLAGLGFGLALLKLAPQHPTLRPLAFLAFAVTGLSIVTVLIRMYWSA